jgi:hypothetical protein
MTHSFKKYYIYNPLRMQLLVLLCVKLYFAETSMLHPYDGPIFPATYVSEACTLWEQLFQELPPKMDANNQK